MLLITSQMSNTLEETGNSMEDIMNPIIVNKMIKTVAQSRIQSNNHPFPFIYPIYPIARPSVKTKDKE